MTPNTPPGVRYEFADSMAHSVLADLAAALRDFVDATANTGFGSSARFLLVACLDDYGISIDGVTPAVSGLGHNPGEQP